MKKILTNTATAATDKIKEVQFKEIQKPDAFARKYILASIFVSLAVWDIAFNLGAFKTIFFDKFFLMWVISLAILLADFSLKDKRLLDKTARFAMLTPTFTAGLTAWIYWFGDTLEVLGWVSFALGSLLTVLFLPYTAYIILHLTREDISDFKESKPLALSLTAIAVFIGIVGFLVGHYNRVLLTCDDFQVSGNDLPDNCVTN